MSGSWKRRVLERMPVGRVCGVALSVLGLLTIEIAHAQAPGSSGATGFGVAAPAPIVRSILKPGSQGTEVTELQATLKLLGFYTGAVNGVYGQDTAASVSQFQQEAGLVADGVVGPATWNRLFPPVPAASGSPPAPALTPQPTAPKPTPAASSTKPATTSTKPTPSTPPRPAASGSDPVALPVLRQGAKGPAVTALQERLRTIGVFEGAIDGVFGAETQTAVRAAQRRFGLEADGVVGPSTWSALLRK